MQFVIIARYCRKSLNVNIVQRVVVADDIDEARRKAKLFFPRVWCGYARKIIHVKAYDAQKHAIIRGVDVELTPFKKTGTKVGRTPRQELRKKRVSLWS